MALPKDENPSANQPPKPNSAQTPQTTAATITNRLNELTTRLRLVEERVNQNKERLRVIDNQILDNKKLLSEETNELNNNMIDLRKSIKNIEDTIHHIIKELELTAKKQDLNIMEKYVDMMDPTRYITKEEFKGLMKKNA